MTSRLKKNSQRNCTTYLEKFSNVFRGQYTSLYIAPKIEEDVMSTLMQWERLHILYLQELYILCVLICLYLSFEITFEKTKILQHTSSNYDNKTKGALQFENIGDAEQGTQNFTLLQNFGKIPSQMQSSFDQTNLRKFQKKKKRNHSKFSIQELCIGHKSYAKVHNGVQVTSQQKESRL
jgi:hypothetical protein